MKHPIFSSYYIKGFFWFRIFGYGVVIKDFKKYGLIFSDRNHLTKRLIIGNYIIKILKP